jgi:hypothetical protein
MWGDINCDDVTCSVSCPAVDLGVSNVVSSGSATTELVTFIILFVTEMLVAFIALVRRVMSLTRVSV